MKKEFIPYLLPMITIIVLFIFVSTNPNITGFAVKDIKDKVAAKVVIFTDSNIVLPKDAVIEVSLDDQKSIMIVKNFIEKNGSWYELKTGSYPLIEYYGEGYSGNHNYALDLESFNLGFVENKDIHTLKIKIYYKDKIISETVREVSK